MVTVKRIPKLGESNDIWNTCYSAYSGYNSAEHRRIKDATCSPDCFDDHSDFVTDRIESVKEISDVLVFINVRAHGASEAYPFSGADRKGADAPEHSCRRRLVFSLDASHDIGPAALQFALVVMGPHVVPAAVEDDFLSEWVNTRTPLPSDSNLTLVTFSADALPTRVDLLEKLVWVCTSIGFIVLPRKE